MSIRRSKIILCISLLLAACLVLLLQFAIDRSLARLNLGEEVLYLPTGNVLKNLSLGHEGLLADLYWMRAVQYYGDKRLKKQTQFSLLYPLIDITTTLDPHLMEAYNFGAIFLSEATPVGAGAPFKAMELLKKGIANNPLNWSLYKNLGFVYYWYLRDYKAASQVFLSGSNIPDSPTWMKTMAADLLAQGGSLKSARFLWEKIYETTDNNSIKENALENLFSLKAKEDLDILQSIVEKVQARLGTRLDSLETLVGLRILKTVPHDPKGFSYEMDRATGKVILSPQSTIRR